MSKKGYSYAEVMDIEVRLLQGILSGVFSNKEMFITMREAAKLSGIDFHDYLVWHSKELAIKFIDHG